MGHHSSDKRHYYILYASPNCLRRYYMFPLPPLVTIPFILLSHHPHTYFLWIKFWAMIPKHDNLVLQDNDLYLSHDNHHFSWIISVHTIFARLISMMRIMRMMMISTKMKMMMTVMIIMMMTHVNVKKWTAPIRDGWQCYNQHWKSGTPKGVLKQLQFITSK